MAPLDSDAVIPLLAPPGHDWGQPRRGGKVGVVGVVGVVGMVLLACLGLLAGGCTRSTLRADEIPTSRPVEGVGRAYFSEPVEAMVVPPTGWKADPLKSSDRHKHQIWISPTRDTAYGVVYAEIPAWVPVALIPRHTLHNAVLDEFMEAMRQDQGEAHLLEKHWNDQEDRLYFKAEGGLYRIDAVLTVRGLSVWAVYAGTLGDQPVNEPEMDLARKARDATQVGREAAAPD